MEKELNQEATDGINEHLHDTLIAISIIAKRLATKLNEEMKKDTEEKSDE